MSHKPLERERLIFNGTGVVNHDQNLTCRKKRPYLNGTMMIHNKNTTYRKEYVQTTNCTQFQKKYSKKFSGRVPDKWAEKSVTTSMFVETRFLRIPKNNNTELYINKCLPKSCHTNINQNSRKWRAASFFHKKNQG